MIHHLSYDCPHYTNKDVLKKNKYDHYPTQVKYIIDFMTLGTKVSPIGSSKYAVHQYPSDIDLFEKVKGCCHLNEVRLKLASRMQHLVYQLVRQRDMYFKKFQCGYDRRYDIYLGKEINGQVVDFNSLVVKQQVSNLYEQHLITLDEYHKIINLINTNINLTNYLTLYYLIHHLMMISWSYDDIMNGYKMLRGNKKVYLYDALTDKSLVKLDIVALVPYPDLKTKLRYVEVTNWFLVQLEDEHGYVENLSIVQEDRIKSLRADIIKYHSKYYYNPLKAAKRFWNYLFELPKTNQVLKMIKTLAPLFSSYISFLNSLATDLKLNQQLYNTYHIKQIDYNQFIQDTRFRLINHAPSCYYQDDINRIIINDLNVNQINQTVDMLTTMYLSDKKIDMLNWI
ncbi:MAG TPA: hypothetical protein VLG50_05290 [Candidatus Saccharimonadales bacterium]|nr:hypothetical protein [Candidatus Saccharimonadales bacterium]